MLLAATLATICGLFSSILSTQKSKITGDDFPKGGRFL